jgi:hypothetical protein
MGRACSTNGERKNPFILIVTKTEENRPIGRPTHRQLDNIEMDLR